MPFNDAAMIVAATALQGAVAYGQLHNGDAGPNGTDNVTTAGREAISWTTPSGSGDFGLATSIDFTNGEAGGGVYSMTVWDTATAGTFYGQFVLEGDNAFDGSGELSVTALDFAGLVS